MRKGIIFVALMLASISLGAQTTLKAQSIYDVNQDDHVSISDVNTVVKKVVENATTDKTVVDTEALLKVLNALNAKIDALRILSTEIASLKSDLEKVKSKVGIEDDAPNLLPGKFSVSATKQVQFTKGNLYWDGSAFKFEDNQVESSTGTNGATWNANHVSHFFWTNLTDYQSGNASYMPYAESYSYSSQSISDEFWCGEDNPLTVEGTSGLYALTSSSSGEWYYLIKSRTNASSLYKYGVTVTNNGTSYENCLIIAPDDFTGTLQSSYTLDEVNNLGLVCLPAAGYRNGGLLSGGGSDGNYWTATPHSSDSNYAYDLYFDSYDIYPACLSYRYSGFSLRLVRGF